MEQKSTIFHIIFIFKIILKNHKKSTKYMVLSCFFVIFENHKMIKNSDLATLIQYSLQSQTLVIVQKTMFLEKYFQFWKKKTFEKKKWNILKIKDFIIIISVGNASCNGKSQNKMNYLYLFKNLFRIKQDNSVTHRKTGKSDENT